MSSLVIWCTAFRFPPKKTLRGEGGKEKDRGRERLYISKSTKKPMKSRLSKSRSVFSNRAPGSWQTWNSNMSPAPAEHSVQAFQSKSSNVLVGTIAILVLFGLYRAKSCFKISTCHTWTPQGFPNFYKVWIFFLFLQKQWTRDESVAIILACLVWTASRKGQQAHKSLAE